MAGRGPSRRRRGGAISGHLPERRHRPRVCRGLGVPPQPDPVAGEPPAGEPPSASRAPVLAQRRKKLSARKIGRKKRGEAGRIGEFGPGGQASVGKAQVERREGAGQPPSWAGGRRGPS
uniref:Uncharacterized protein n=1 Tax=Setaria viridis TaxID=4556 RepID=A0A4U6WBZ6_SETVI|nr:hypothetical protein SEVIR_1G216300v2 [Setaria viridis]